MLKVLGRIVPADMGHLCPLGGWGEECEHSSCCEIQLESGCAEVFTEWGAIE